MKPWSELEECTIYCKSNAVFRARHRIDFALRKAEIDRDCPSCGSPN